MKVGSTWMLGIVLSLALAVPAAAQEMKTITVPAEALVLNGNAPDDPGNCSAVVFVKWKDVRGTTSATAFYTSNGQARSQASAPPFDDVYKWVATYTVEPGFHWIAVGKSWQDGPIPSDCSEVRDRIKANLDPVARVELQVPAVDAKACSSARKNLAAKKKAVRKAKQRLADASGKKARKRLKGKLKKAKAKRDKAAARVKKRC